MSQYCNTGEIVSFFDNKTVALVGPANNLIGKNKGKLIDSFDIVARLNDSYIIDEHQYADYGSRCDVLLNTCNCELLCIIKRFSNYLNGCKFIINPTSKVHGADFVNTKKNVYENFLDIDLDIPFYQVEEPFSSLMQKKNLNTGMCAISFLHSLNIDLNIFGFSFHGLNNDKYKIDSSHVASYETYLFDYKKVYTCKTNCPPSSPCRIRKDPRYATVAAESHQLNFFKESFLNKDNIVIDDTIINELK